jgi:hypothetical protein
VKELVCKLDLQFHGWNIAQRLYFVKAVTSAVSWRPQYAGRVRPVPSFWR